MDGFGPSTYGDGFADVYDDWYGAITDDEATAEFCAARAVPGAVLELGVGSGRLVPALEARGLKVIGVDASAAMLSEAKERQPGIVVLRADLEHLPVGTGVGLALCAFNTLFNLPTPVAQGRLLAAVGAALAPGAALVIEAMTGLGLADGPSTSVGVSNLTTDRLVLSATVVDHEAQTIQGQHVDFTEAGTKLRPWFLRWTTPEELDELAGQAGLMLAERYEDWSRQPFGPESEHHVSVYLRTDTRE